MASDGIWDVMRNQEAVNIVHRELSQNDDPRQCAEELVDHASVLKSKDNLTATVVCFTWCEPGVGPKLKPTGCPKNWTGASSTLIYTTRTSNSISRKCSIFQCDWDQRQGGDELESFDFTVEPHQVEGFTPNLLSTIKMKLTDDQRRLLDMPFTAIEVKDALFQMDGLKLESARSGRFCGWFLSEILGLDG